VFSLVLAEGDGVQVIIAKGSGNRRSSLIYMSAVRLVIVVYIRVHDHLSKPSRTQHSAET